MEGKYLAEEYVAGFFDGEGCIGLYNSSRGVRSSCNLRVTIVQVRTRETEELLNHLASCFGGKAAVYPMTEQRDKLQWQINGAKAIEFLRFVKGSLRLKKKQCLTAIEWFEGRELPSRDSGGRMRSKSQQAIDRDEMYITRLKEMKKVGY